ncbi:MAG: twin-arginine translocation signal domain-containing protein, partial [Pseudomonadota bacterium]
MDMLSRRIFLQGMAATGGLAAISSSTALPAHAVNTGGYKALVGIFLKGGLDYGDIVMPTDQAQYDMLRGVREDMFASYNGANTPSRALGDLLGLNIANSADL